MARKAMKKRALFQRLRCDLTKILVKPIGERAEGDRYSGSGSLEMALSQKPVSKFTFYVNLMV